MKTDLLVDGMESITWTLSALNYLQAFARHFERGTKERKIGWNDTFIREQTIR